MTDFARSRKESAAQILLAYTLKPREQILEVSPEPRAAGERDFSGNTERVYDAADSRSQRSLWMRVAISGTHCCGKSTLIDAFLLRHGEYVHEPEAYEALQVVHGEAFACEPSADDFYRQLEYHIGRLHQYCAGDCVMFERSPADYLAYLLALGDLDRDTAYARLTERSIEAARVAVALLDLIVFLPASGGGGGVPESEDPELRHAVDARLEGILIDDAFGMFTGNRPSVLEAFGTTAQRLRTLETALR